METDSRRSSSLRGRLLVGMLLMGVVFGAAAQTDQPIYTDSLQNNWANWGWATINYYNTSPVHSGSDSISVSCTNYEALYIHHSPFDSTPYTDLSFWINGGSGGQTLKVQATVNQSAQTNFFLIPSLSPNTWQQVTIPLSALGVANQANMDGFWIQSTTQAQLPTFYVDDITLTASSAPPVTNTAVSIAVDGQLNRHPINPLIYGVAFASSNQLADLNFTLNRSGGNAETRYNWRTNAHNRARDWYFESIADNGPGTPAATADSFVANSLNGGAQPLLTIPMIGWVPKLGAGRGKLASYSIAKYGPQTGNDWQWMPDAGNGVGTNTSLHTSWLITTNDPTDANFATDSTFQQAFIQHLTNRWGLSTNGGVRYYLMDNEHTLWHETHRDVHPVGATMTEIRDRIFEYAGVVKALDPNALVLAPEEWGWSGYLYSGYDLQYGSQHGWSFLPDRAANGGWDYMPWLLDQFRQRATNTHQRLVDYFTLHIYPQGGESGDDVSAATQLLRNRSTRSLWDTNYVDASWINSVVMLIPRMRSWVATYYPGTKIGITEYNWGAEGHINGATAQADILGIFGREGLDLATRWTTPGTNTPTYKALKLYRNYDGNKSGFGDTSVAATVPNPDDVAAFAAVRSSDRALTVMVINKQLTASAALTATVTNFANCGAAEVWQLTATNLITHPGSIRFTGNVFTNPLPPQSITLFVLPSPPRLRAGATSGTNTFNFWLDGQTGERYLIESSTDLADWAPVQTNTLSSNSWQIVVPATDARRFYRGGWVP